MLYNLACTSIIEPISLWLVCLRSCCLPSWQYQVMPLFPWFLQYLSNICTWWIFCKSLGSELITSLLCTKACDDSPLPTTFDLSKQRKPLTPRPQTALQTSQSLHVTLSKIHWQWTTQLSWTFSLRCAQAVLICHKYLFSYSFGQLYSFFNSQLSCHLFFYNMSQSSLSLLLYISLCVYHKIKWNLELHLICYEHHYM